MRAGTSSKQHVARTLIKDLHEKLRREMLACCSPISAHRKLLAVSFPWHPGAASRHASHAWCPAYRKPLDLALRLHVSCHLSSPFCLGPGNARNPKLDTSHVVRLILRAAHLCVPLWLRSGGANAGCPAMRARRGWGVGRMQLGEASLQCLALGSNVFSLARWWRRPLRRDDQRALHILYT